MSPRCGKCKRPLFEMRLVVVGQWLCADCLYEDEYGPTRHSQHYTTNRRQPQAETLFPLPPAQSKARRQRRGDDGV
jgi:hypothetical protein